MPYKWRAATLSASWLIVTLVPLIGVPVLQPAIGEEFGTSVAYTSWVSLAYSLAMAGAFVPASHMGDLLGHKRVALMGSYLEVVLMGSIMFMPNLPLVIAMRFLQGLVHSMAVPNFQAFAVAAFPREERGRVLGFSSGLVGSGMLVVPLGVGTITDGLGWRWVFGLGALLILIVTVVGQAMLREGAVQTRARPGIREFDMPGAVLLMAGVAPFIIGLQMARRTSEAWPWALMAVGVLLAVAFLVYESRVKYATLPVRIFKRASALVPQIHNFLFNYSHGVAVYILPIFFIQGLGWTAAYAGAVMVWYSVGRPPASFVAGFLTDRFGSATVVVASAVVQLSGLVGLAVWGTSGSILVLAPCLILYGLANSMVGIANQQQAYAAMPKDQFAMAGGTMGLGRHLSQAVGTGIAAGVFSAIYADVGGTAAQAASGFRSVMTVTALVFAAGMTLSYALPALWRAARGPQAPARSPADVG